MEILKDFAKMGIKILSDTKTPKNAAAVGKKVSTKATVEPILTIHQAFVKRAIKEKPKKKEIVEFFQTVCEAEESKL